MKSNKKNEAAFSWENTKRTTIDLSPEDQRKFAEQLINPPKLTPAMKRAIERHKTLIKSS